MGKILGIASGSLMIIILVLWGAWALDSRPSNVKGGQLGEEFSVQMSAKEQDDIPCCDVMLQCWEDVLDEPSEAFAKWFKLEGVPLELPGGPMAIAHLNDLVIPESFKPAQRAGIEALKRYSPSRIVLVEHTGCLYYDTMAAWADKLAEVRQRQISDVQTATKILREWFPKAEVFSYITGEENGKMVFRPVTGR